MNSNFCKGCGVELQTTDINTSGFVQEKHLRTSLCQRCFKIKQYSEFQKVDIDNEKLLDMIKNYDETTNLLTLVVDMTDLVETCLFELSGVLKKFRIIVVINKIDVILADMRHYDIWEAYVKDLFFNHEINVEEFFFVSAKELLGVKRLIRYYETIDFENIKIIGCANVGKSSLIQALFSDSMEESNVLPTVFMTPGTTLDELHLSWKQFNLYDTPGIMKPQQLTYYLTNKMIKQILIQKPIKPRNYHIYEPQTFFIGGYAQVNVFPKDNNTITFFCENTVPIHRKKYVTDNTFYEQHIGGLLAPPSKKDYEKTPALSEKETHNIMIKRNKTDIVIAGLGWISINQKNTKVEIITVAGIKVYTQHAIV